MQLGAEYSAVSTGQLGYQFFRHVFFSRTVLYILLAGMGYLFYVGLPGHYADEPSMSSTPELVRTVSTIVAGVLLSLRRTSCVGVWRGTASASNDLW